MLILTIRTDKPVSEIGLFNEGQEIDKYTWEAHRQLAETLNVKIKDLLAKNGKSDNDLSGVIAYTGPGSFTGLRIGISTANAISFALSIPIVGTNGEDWEKEGSGLLRGNNSRVSVLPNYGAEANITLPRK
jgi:tRNA threonylcarbamoyladenosine biosynthesis protein TsaB